MKIVRRWFWVAILLIVIANVLIQLFVFPDLPRDVQVTVAYVSNVIVFVILLYVSLAVLWQVIKYVLLNPPKKG